MAKKNYFQDLLSEEDLLSSYKNLADEVKKRGKQSDFVSQNDSTQIVTSGPDSSTLQEKKRGRPKKEANDVTEKSSKRYHIDISYETRTKITMCSGLVSVSNGKKMSVDKLLSIALDAFMEKEFPDVFKSFKLK